MRSLNWPNLMATSPRKYLVQKTYVEYSSLETYTPRLYDGATNAMNYWRGDLTQRWGIGLQRVRDLCQSLREGLQYYAESGYEDELEGISQLEMLYNDIASCETFEDLTALGSRMQSIDLSDYEIYDSGYINLEPQLGIFIWEVRYSTDETYVYHSKMFDISLLSLSD